MTAKNIKNKIELNASVRTEVGSQLGALRRDGNIPAVLYGKGIDNVSIKVNAKDFSKVLKEAGESTLVYLSVDGSEYPTIITEVVSDPISSQYIHADFHKVNLKEKIKAHVPVVFEGESSAVKDLKGVFVRNVNEIEVEALPQDLPHEISVDISVLKELGAQILAKDLKLPNGVELQTEADAIIALVQEPMSEEELKASLEGEAKTVDDVEVIEKEKTEEIPADDTSDRSSE